MRLLDLLRASHRDQREQEELRTLREKLAQGRGEREAVISRVPLPALAGEILDYEGVFSPPPLPGEPSPAETVQYENLFRRLLALREGNGVEAALRELVEPLASCLPPLPEGGEDFGLSVSVLDRLQSPVAVLDGIVRAGVASPFPRLQEVARTNLLLASGIDPANPSRKTLVMPSAAKEASAAALADQYLRGTPLLRFLQTPSPFTIPAHVRFEHTHILGGSGHGKTQLLQHLILRDLDGLKQGRGSVIVIDSQGDMIRTITHLAEFRPSAEGSLADRLVLIDPNDIEYPPCLNLFDIGLDRLDRYSAVEREKLLNGAIALYEYMFGALLGAELSQRQGVIFRYLGRLLMTVPGATIHTLMRFIEDPEAARPHVVNLEGSARHFFETQFPSNAFKDTRQQILNRLWGILSNSVLERMFSNERNKVNLFDAMNSGKIILINTAKDLLKQDGCAILGRFFIALITQAAQERAAIPAEKRRATFLYIDETQDYFDESIEQLFNQARKYKVGLTIAHQNLDQFGSGFLASVMASTAIKLTGGMSAKDASLLAREMRCESELLQSMRKHADHTEFACFVKNVTAAPLRLSVPFGTMERRPRLTDAEHEELLARNRARYSAEMPMTVRQHVQAGEGFELGRPEVF